MLCVGFRQHGENLVALGGSQRFGDAAGNNPSGMNALGAEQFDDVLPEAAQRDAGAAQFRLGGHNAEDVALRGIGLPSPAAGRETTDRRSSARATAPSAPDSACAATARRYAECAPT